MHDPANRFAYAGRARASAPSLCDDLPTQRKPDPERRAHDFYPTGQPEAIRGLLSLDGDVIRACGSVWEPACGDGALVKEIRNAGILCYASDLIDQGCPDGWTADFFTCLRSRGRHNRESPCKINGSLRLTKKIGAKLASGVANRLGISAFPIIGIRDSMQFNTR